MPVAWAGKTINDSQLLDEVKLKELLKAHNDSIILRCYVCTEDSCPEYAPLYGSSNEFSIKVVKANDADADFSTLIAMLKKFGAAPEITDAVQAVQFGGEPADIVVSRALADNSEATFTSKFDDGDLAVAGAGKPSLKTRVDKLVDGETLLVSTYTDGFVTTQCTTTAKYYARIQGDTVKELDTAFKTVKSDLETGFVKANAFYEISKSVSGIEIRERPAGSGSDDTDDTGDSGSNNTNSVTKKKKISDSDNSDESGSETDGSPKSGNCPWWAWLIGVVAVLALVVGAVLLKQRVDGKKEKPAVIAVQSAGAVTSVTVMCFAILLAGFVAHVRRTTNSRTARAFVAVELGVLAADRELMIDIL